MDKSIVFIDTEVSSERQKPCDYGAIDSKGGRLHTNSQNEFERFIDGNEYVCGHNLIAHDAKYTNLSKSSKLIDTLYLSPLLFPERLHHSLPKDDKLLPEEPNNPLNDSQKAMELFYEEVDAFESLDGGLQRVYYTLLESNPNFRGFWEYLGYDATYRLESLEGSILGLFRGRVCENAPLTELIQEYPAEVAYCLSTVSSTERVAIVPMWVQKNFPRVGTVVHLLRSTPCYSCTYCRERLSPHRYLEKYFGYERFRTYNGEPLQEDAIDSAIRGESLLAIFPTGGGKSLTFQIPALMAGEAERGLTVVVSPLQSLMKDQVYSFEKRGLEGAVMLNGLLSPLERSEAIERVESGIASILYISPESLRSYTVEKLLLSRQVSRFVVDEAHCFSEWGQDFRVDYLYIGDFIRGLQEKKGDGRSIPVSCFTATAKQNVIKDVQNYFKSRLGLDLRLFATDASRTNLTYSVLPIHSDGKYRDEEKYRTLRELIQSRDCPTIVYVSRTKRTLELADRLRKDGFRAGAFNGKMDSVEKQACQDAFTNDELQVMVATSAFGMGVDKSNVGLVVHYDISDSLENYVQEAGRAGRNQDLQAECYVLFANDDLDKHFILLNQTRLSINEIQQVWKAVKTLTKTKPQVRCSPLEVARQAGWDDTTNDIETRVKTAIQALENSGYLQRGKDVPKVYASSILVDSMAEASVTIESSTCFQDDRERTTARRVISSLIHNKSVSKAENTDAESRVDYLADLLGLEKSEVVSSIQKMRNCSILADTRDLTAYIKKSDTQNKSQPVLDRYHDVEMHLLDTLDGDRFYLNYKELNDEALNHGIKRSSVNAIKTLFYYWTIRGYVQKEQDESTNRVTLVPRLPIKDFRAKREKCYRLSEYVVEYLFNVALRSGYTRVNGDETLVGFSILNVIHSCRDAHGITVTASEVEESLLFLSKVDAIKLDGGFLVLYNTMQIKRLELDNRIKYKVEDYRQLKEFYRQKVYQIHIVGEYANMMVSDHDRALRFVDDYFQMDYKKFLAKYFSGERAEQIQHNITPQKYHQVFGTLSPKQLEIIKDRESKYIVCTAGPGSGKTRVLVHKLASLLIMEDVKHEQLLMLTFSRNAVIEFKSRLRELIGNATAFVEIKTFHSYCFDILGKIGSIEESANVVQEAGKLIRSGDVDVNRITKSVLVIDEAQDMDGYEFKLVQALMEHNEDMRIVAVGDDDQNIYEFRGSDSKYLECLITDYHAKQYDLVDDYRSSKSIVAFANAFVRCLSNRLKSVEVNAVSDSVGTVVLTKHTCTHLENAIADDVLANTDGGTTCVLTNTNEEALNVLGVLNRRGIRAKLIQSNETFDTYDIAEFRYFTKKLKSSGSTPTVSNERWDSAVEALKNNYADSSILPLVLRVLKVFSDDHPHRYLMDFETYLHESRLESFYRQEEGVITVSTMHKSKGREFDSVYVMLDCPNLRYASDQDKRKVYVAITRAKSRLHIHYTGNALDEYRPYATTYSLDSTVYERPAEVTLQLYYEDVHLDFFKGKKLKILKLRSGYPLKVNLRDYTLDQHGKPYPLVRFSRKCIGRLQKLMNSGYYPYSAEVRFIVAWKGKKDTEESAVILPNVTFRLK